MTSRKPAGKSPAGFFHMPRIANAGQKTVHFETRGIRAMRFSHESPMPRGPAVEHRPRGMRRWGVSATQLGKVESVFLGSNIPWFGHHLVRTPLGSSTPWLEHPLARSPLGSAGFHLYHSFNRWPLIPLGSKWKRCRHAPQPWDARPRAQAIGRRCEAVRLRSADAKRPEPFRTINPVRRP